MIFPLPSIGKLFSFAEANHILAAILISDLVSFLYA